MDEKKQHGGRRSGAGRPPNNRTIPISVRVSPEAAQVLEGVKNKSEYIDTLLIREKKEVKPIK